MRIVCDSCGAKYQISDDKVRNKVFKIRCKRCTNVIVVRAGQDQGADSPAGQSIEEPARLADPGVAEETSDAIWYVVVNREQLGPMTKADVEARFERGEIDAETFSWAEGMGEWIRLGSIPEFADLVMAAAPPAPAPVQAQAPAPMQAAVQAPRFAAADPDEDVIASNNRSPDGPAQAPAASLFGRDDDGFDEGPRVSNSRHLRGQRNENSVLFSLDSLAADVDAARPSVANTGGKDGSGLIDIGALGPTPGSQASLDSAFGGGAMAPVPAAPAAPMPTYVTPRSGGSMKIAIAVMFVLLLGAGVTVAFLLLNKDKNTGEGATVASAPATAAAPVTVAVAAPPTAAAAPVTVAAAPPSVAAATEASVAAPESVAMAAPETAAERRPAAAAGRPVRTPRRGGSDGSPEEDSPPPEKPAAVPSAAPATAAARKPRGSDTEVDDLLGSLDGNRAAKPAGNPDKPVANNAGSDDPTLPERLSRQQILLVVKQGAGSIRGCKTDDVSGTVMVAMVIEAKGNVSSATAQGPQKGTSVGSCVEGKVMGFKFPQFHGEPMRINMPFGL